MSVPGTLSVAGYTSLEVSSKIQAIWCLGFAQTGKSSCFPPTMGAGGEGGGGDLCFCKSKIQQSVAILSQSGAVIGCLHRLWVQGMRRPRKQHVSTTNLSLLGVKYRGRSIASLTSPYRVQISVYKK